MFLPTSHIPNTTIAYLPAFRKGGYVLYGMVLLMVLVSKYDSQYNYTNFYIYYIMIKVLLAALLLFCSNVLYAQIVTIQGKVIDGKNKTGLPAVSIAVGTTATSTDKKGNFSLAVDLSLLLNKGVRFSSVGYTKQHLIYQPNHFYEVEMFESTTSLKEVIIGAGDNIIRKACKNIPKNYPNQPTVLTGILRAQLTRNRSFYFKSDEIIKAYVLPYTDNEKTSVMLVQNKLDTINDRTLRYMRWVSASTAVANYDIVHNRASVIQLSKMKKYDYRLVGKQWYQKHRVYVINVSLKDTSKTANQWDVVLYIDTACYAFVAANVTGYNIERIGFIKQAKANYSITYQEIGKKWYIKEIHAEGYHVYQNEAPESKVDFICTQIDSTNVSPFAYKDIIQERDDIQQLQKEGDKNEWLKYDSLFVNAEADNRMNKISPNTLDTIRQRSIIDNTTKPNRSFFRGIVNYIAHNNIREELGIAKFPLNITQQAVGLDIHSYGLSSSINFRLYHNLFFEFQQCANFPNSTNANVSELALNLSNEFIFNKNSHTVTIMPYAGYKRLVVYDKYHEIDYNTFNFGFQTSYELTHKKALFFSTGYNTTSDKRDLDGLSITPVHYTISTGIIFKL